MGALACVIITFHIIPVHHPRPVTINTTLVCLSPTSIILIITTNNQLTTTTASKEEVEGPEQCLPLGVPPLPPPVSSQLSCLHQVGRQRQRGLQAGGQQGGLQAVGTAQEQAGHELRDHGESSEILLSERNPGQGGRPETCLSIC